MLLYRYIFKDTTVSKIQEKMMTPQEQEAHTERTRLGDSVKQARFNLQEAEDTLTHSKNTANGYRAKKAKYQTELEILSAKDEDSLGYELKLRKLDLQKDIAELEGFVGGNEKNRQVMEHDIEMRNHELNTRQSAYNDFVREDDAVVTPSIRAELDSIPRSSNMMTDERRNDIINRFGFEVYQSIPVI